MFNTYHRTVIAQVVIPLLIEVSRMEEDIGEQRAIELVKMS